MVRSAHGTDTGRYRPSAWCVSLIDHTYPGDFCFTQEPGTGTSCTVRHSTAVVWWSPSSAPIVPIVSRGSPEGSMPAWRRFLITRTP